MPIDMTGGRHAASAPPRPAVLWRCPSCNAENSGRLEAGCASCGSGKPGEHVGVPPPAVRTQSTEVRKSTVSADEAFLAWRKRTDLSNAVETQDVFYLAFMAGWQAALATVVQPELRLSGTAQSRTVIAALRFWIEQQVPLLKEEIASGEYLGRDEIEELIQKLERTNG